MITTARDFPVVIMIRPIVQYLAIRTSNIYWAQPLHNDWLRLARADINHCASPLLEWSLTGRTAGSRKTLIER